MCLQLGFVFFWQKEIGPKAAHKMLMKLTQGINFTIHLVQTLLVHMYTQHLRSAHNKLTGEIATLKMMVKFTMC